MGLFMGEDDVQIPALFAVMNERFAPSNKDDASDKQRPRADGIVEMAKLQKKFDIFRTGKDAPTFRECAALLNLGGSLPWSLRQKWYRYLDWLHTHCTSDDPHKCGSEGICAKLRENLAYESPKPVFFMPYDYGDEKKVLIEEKDVAQSPLFYIQEEYLVIKLPMKARDGRP
ncbi:MAG: hypothetical protein WBN88_21805 [Anderseniella sp.]